MPELPSIAESGIPGFHFANFYGYLMPAGSPQAAGQRVSSELQGIAQLPAVRQQLEAAGLAAVGSTPEALGDTMRSAYDKILQIVKSAHIEFTG